MFTSYVASLWFKMTQFRDKHYANELSQFRELASSTLELTDDWFTHNIPMWEWVMARHLEKKAPLRVLEIGSFEGLSTRYFLSALPSSHVTCVDTFRGSPEHQGNETNEALDFGIVKGNFDRNTAGFESRISVERRTSLEFFAYLADSELFDLVYVDGSHHSDDVLLDGILSFRHLREGGLLIFDDYMWEFFPNRKDNPGAAIDAFLSLKGHELEIVHVGMQVVVKRLLFQSA